MAKAVVACSVGDGNVDVVEPAEAGGLGLGTVVACLLPTVSK